MATRVTWSQTCTIGPNPPLFLGYNPLSAFGSNQWGTEVVNQFLSFLALWAMHSISKNCLPPESPTPATCIIILPNNYKSPKSESHLFGYPTAFDSSTGGPRFPRNGPPGPPSDDDDPDFPNNDLFAPGPDSDEESPAEQIPMDMTAQLASTIQKLAHYSCRPSSNSTPHAEVQEPDQFDGTNS